MHYDRKKKPRSPPDSALYKGCFLPRSLSEHCGWNIKWKLSAALLHFLWFIRWVSDEKPFEPRPIKFIRFMQFSSPAVCKWCCCLWSTFQQIDNFFAPRSYTQDSFALLTITNTNTHKMRGKTSNTFAQKGRKIFSLKIEFSIDELQMVQHDSHCKDLMRRSSNRFTPSCYANAGEFSSTWAKMFDGVTSDCIKLIRWSLLKRDGNRCEK